MATSPSHQRSTASKPLTKFSRTCKKHRNTSIRRLNIPRSMDGGQVLTPSTRTAAGSSTKRYTTMRQTFICLGIFCFFIPAVGCAKPNLRESLANMQAPEGESHATGIYEPWFWDQDHIHVGFSCLNLMRSSRDRQSPGAEYRRFVVNWYGPRKQFEDQSYGTLRKWQQDISRWRPVWTKLWIIGYAQMQSSWTSNISMTSTSAAVLALRVSPIALQRQAGDFISPKDASTDWDRVRQVTQSWPDPPLLFTSQSSNIPRHLDGYHALGATGKGGWSPMAAMAVGTNLDNFLQQHTAHHPDRLR